MKRSNFWGARRVAAIMLPAALLAAVWTLQAEQPQTDVGPQIRQPRIIGGDPVDSGTYPWLVAIERVDRLNLPDGNFEAQFCAGAVIAPNWVLTAGHCTLVPGSTTLFWEADDLKVLVGSTDLIDDEGQLIDVEQIVRHEEFTFSLAEAKVENDIALLKLSSPVDVTPVTLNSLAENEAPGLESITAGWGDTDPGEGRTFPSRLREVSVPLVSLQDCQAAYSQTNPPAQILASHLCAGLLGEGGKDACEGDSGGPLFVDDGMSGPVQTGITSFGAGCANPAFPGVYTRVSSYLAWIDQKIFNTLFFSQIGKGGSGEVRLSSDVVVFNHSPDKAASGEVLFWDPDGNAIDPALFLTSSSLNPSGQGSPPVNAFSLPPLGAAVFQTDELGDLQIGSATVIADSPVSAVVRFSLNGGIAGVRSSIPASELITPVRFQNGVRTGVAVRNTEAAPVTVTLALHDAAGEMLASDDRDLEVNGRIAQFADEIFPGQVTEGFLGTLTITCQECKVAAIALELGGNPGEFTALPVSIIQ